MFSSAKIQWVNLIMSDFMQSKWGYVRRGALLILALLAVGAIVFGGYEWKVYHRNLAVSDANLLPLPALNGKDRILILSPHPDDETLGAGGLIAKARHLGLPVRVVFLTNGDGSLATRLVQDANFVEQMAKGKDPRRPHNIYREIAPMRQKEATAALAKLNIAARDITFLGYPDGGTKAMWETHWNAADPYRSPYTKTDHSPYANSPTPKAPYCGAGALKDVEQILISFKPTIVITTSTYDTHPDHWAAYAYLSAAVCQLQLQQKYFSWAEKIRCYTFLIHHGLWPAPHGYHPDEDLSPPAALVNIGAAWLRLPLNKMEEKTKENALLQYKSQLATTPQFLRGFVRRNELFRQEKKGKTSGSWEEILRDPRQDLLLPQLVAAGDITSLSLKKAGGKVLLLKIDLDGKPWADLQYVVSLHAVTPGNVYVHQITIEANNKHQWQGTLISAGSSNSTLQVNVANNQIIVRCPETSFNPENNAKNISLISASTLFHGRVLDQTPTAIVR
jgi:LmbE family N-acetylglucosaminyl deacetylase